MSQKTNVHDILKTDHAEIEEQYEGYKMAGEKRKEVLAKKILLDLVVHAELEEEFYYPELEKIGKTIEVAHFREEHEEIRMIIDKLAMLDPESPHYDGAFGELMDSVIRHAEDEEERMPEFETVLGIPLLEEIGAKILSKKQSVIESVMDEIEI